MAVIIGNKEKAGTSNGLVIERSPMVDEKAWSEAVCDAAGSVDEDAEEKVDAEAKPSEKPEVPKKKLRKNRR